MNIGTADFTREIASELVAIERRKTGSRMVAYEAVAAAIGTTSGWLRKFISGHEAKEPGWAMGWKILDHYSRICDRVEAEIETERARTQALKGMIDAANEIAIRVVESTTRAKGG